MAKPKQNDRDFVAQAAKVLVGGVNSPLRNYQSVRKVPLILRSAKGVLVGDYHNKTYTDYCLSSGALILGHAHRNVVVAAKKTAERGINFGTTTRAEIDLARFIVKAVPSIEKIRFMNSGTEAVMSAVRLARGLTGRTMIIKFDGCYHGVVDALMVKAGARDPGPKEATSAGIPDSIIADTLSLPFNDAQALQDAIGKYKDRVAAVIVEPVAGHMGVVPAQQEFLEQLRALTQEHKIVLIFDEMITGFRGGIGGAQEELRMIPDLTCLGHIIGGGFPVGALGGKEEIMNHLAPTGPVSQSGTFSGNPVVMWAGLSSLKLLSPNFFATLNERAESFFNDLNNCFLAEDIDCHCSFYHSMASLSFSRQAPENYDQVLAAEDTKTYGALFRFLLRKGILLPPATSEAFYICGLHKKRDLAALKDAILQFFHARKEI